MLSDIRRPHEPAAAEEERLRVDRIALYGNRRFVCVLTHDQERLLAHAERRVTAAINHFRDFG